MTIRVTEAADILGVTAQTLRNWEKSGRLVPQRSPGGQRRYVLSEMQRLAVDLPKLAWAWASSAQPPEIPDEYYCQQPDRFSGRLTKMGTVLEALPGGQAQGLASLLTSVAGEIGDNSFAHNIGNWPDVPGIFFAYDLQKRRIFLADRGQGIRATLQRVRPNIVNDGEAIHIAFTETISGRSPEKRGNGLKLVKKIAETNPIGLTLTSGIAQATIPAHGHMRVRAIDRNVRGVVTEITF
ncbi:MAG: MerR family DNA-binding transcriptional regulator [Candidatus Kerfeldbacteria bacterium]|nr:MerR family DNA-binding transcriptional regulator [Candidatus Kerfeldbacteria bacterium]